MLSKVVFWLEFWPFSRWKSNGSLTVFYFYFSFSWESWIENLSEILQRSSFSSLFTGSEVYLFFNFYRTLFWIIFDNELAQMLVVSAESILVTINKRNFNENTESFREGVYDSWILFVFWKKNILLCLSLFEDSCH